MESLKVDPARLSQLAESIKSNSDKIGQELEQLGSAVSKLRGQWSGEAQVSYDQAQRNWNQQIGEMNALLAQISGKTNEIAQGYVSTDAAAAKRFSV